MHSLGSFRKKPYRFNIRVFHALFRNERFGLSASKYLRWILLLGMLTLGCQLVTGSSVAEPTENVTTTDEGGVPIPTADFSPTPAPFGQGRSNPLVVGTVIDLPNWEVSVLEIGRDESALNAIYGANSGNDAPYEGLEFLLLKLSILKKPNADENSSLSLGTTGDRQRLYYTFIQSVVAPEPRLPYGGDMAAGERVEGWEVFFAGINEKNLLLRAEDSSMGDNSVWFLQLEPNVVHEVPASLSQIEATDNGITPKQAALFGDIVTSEDWQLHINRMIQGEEAWQMAYATNSLNDPPEKGMIYIALELTVSYIGQDDSRPLQVSRFDFEVYDDAGIFHDPPSLVNPEPELGDIRLYPGGEVTGWVMVQMPENTENPILVFEPPNDHNGRQTRYLSLKTGR